MKTLITRFFKIYSKNSVSLIYGTETVFSWYIQSLVLKCAYFISLSNGNTFRSLTIPKRKWYLCICYHFNTLLLIKVEQKIFVFIYCTEQLNLKNIYWHYFTTKIMSICPIWNFTLYVTQSLHFFENHPKADYDRMVIKFRNAHAVAKHSKSFCDYQFLCKLDQAKGWTLGTRIWMTRPQLHLS